MPPRISKEMQKEWEGRTVDGFTLERFLDGAVFLTTFQSQRAAIKLFAPGEQARLAEAAQVQHPNLIRVLQTGRAFCGNNEVAYAVMEYAEENLGEVLRERALTTAEARDLLKPLLGALDAVHKKGLVFARLKPANILASGDKLKLAPDTLERDGSTPRFAASAYDPPDREELTAAWDSWSLGVVMVEALTQKTVSAAPANLPEPFATIAHECLQPDAGRRWTIARIAQFLNEPLPKAAVAGRTGPPLALWAVAILGVLLVAGVIARHAASSPARTPPVKLVETVPEPPPVAPSPQPAPVAQTNPEQPMPEILPEARAGIKGHVKVSVKLETDASGAVTNAALSQRSGSRYFDARALEAVRKWRFAAADGPQHYIVQFEFLNSGTKVNQRRVAP